MCREPLLSGKHAMTRNRALEELLGRMQHVQTESEGESSEHQVLITIKDDGVEHESDTDEPTDKRSLPRRIYDRLLHVQRRTQQVLSSVRLQQWRHWCRIHWATLQCVFYVLLFGALVFFLRVQEEDYAEHSHRLMH
ncbi:hypothetical protein Poli38472_010322 [Pythium oligandrum]|uniref:Uncharacterized protein n=1 Tax=Pythium oligandrum TaxID=41045 RepID=A0A8K1F9P5_PYTOL|nr:hypothetical protein Poli38472_010322 [Pythium oligandrum]|eukprot:TMW55440.1 hypothetical protein Poli38472_010322 [Pythium oligandrum]